MRGRGQQLLNDQMVMSGRLSTIARGSTEANVISVPTLSTTRGTQTTRRTVDLRPGPGVAAVLFDRDDTLVHDVPYNGDPALVRPIAGMGHVLSAARHAGFLLGVVTNQSGIARGLITPSQVATVNAAVERQLGPFDTWQVCPHRGTDGCSCRKPQPGLIQQAAAALGLQPARCALVGDRASDVAAGRLAGLTHTFHIGRDGYARALADWIAHL